MSLFKSTSMQMFVYQIVQANNKETPKSGITGDKWVPRTKA